MTDHKYAGCEELVCQRCDDYAAGDVDGKSKDVRQLEAVSATEQEPVCEEAQDRDARRAVRVDLPGNDARSGPGQVPRQDSIHEAQGRNITLDTEPAFVHGQHDFPQVAQLHQLALGMSVCKAVSHAPLRFILGLVDLWEEKTDPCRKGATMYRILIAAIVVLFGLIGLGAEEGSCEIPEDITPTPQPTFTTIPKPTPTPVPTQQPDLTLGVSSRTIEELFKDTGYTPFDQFGETERSAMFFDGGGGAVMVSLFGYPHDLESIGVTFGDLNAKTIVTLTIGGLIEELAPDWEDRVMAWIDANYPSGGRKKTQMSAGPLLVTLDTASTPNRSGWIAEVLLEAE